MPRVPVIYSHPLLYQLVMRGLYGRHYRDRYEAIAAEIADQSDVLDVCAGDCRLYTQCLSVKGVRYRAVDFSPVFVRAARAKGIDATLLDVRRDELPRADVVVMEASLYQFLPDAGGVLEKLLRAARAKLIVAEPVRNLSSSSLGWLAGLSGQLTRVSEHHPLGAPARFDEPSLEKLFTAAPGFQRMFPIPGGREVVGIFRGARP